jgi:hypothetical protein
MSFSEPKVHTPVISLFDLSPDELPNQLSRMTREALEDSLRSEINNNPSLARRLVGLSRVVSGPNRHLLLALALEHDQDKPAVAREVLRECDDSDMLAIVAAHLSQEVRAVLSRSDHWYSVVSDVVKRTRAAFTRGFDTDACFQTLEDLFAMRRRSRNSFIEEYGILSGLAMDMNNGDYQLRVFSLLPLTSTTDSRGERKAAIKCAIADFMSLQLIKPASLSQQVLSSLLKAFQQYN